MKRLMRLRIWILFANQHGCFPETELWKQAAKDAKFFYCITASRSRNVVLWHRHPCMHPSRMACATRALQRMATNVQALKSAAHAYGVELFAISGSSLHHARRPVAARKASGANRASTQPMSRCKRRQSKPAPGSFLRPGAMCSCPTSCAIG